MIRKLSKCSVLFACSALLALTPVAAQVVETEAQLYAQAKKEGSVNWYVAHYSTKIGEDISQAFEQRYPGIKVNVIKTTGQVAFQRVMQDIKAKNVQSDIFSSPDVGHFEILKKQGSLLKFIPENAAQTLKDFQNFDPENYYHITWAMIVILAYNSNKISAEQAPKKWSDLLDSKWKNQISLGNPNFSSSASVWALLVRQLYGDDYFKKLELNQPLVSRSIDDTINILNSGERFISVSGLSTASRSINSGNPIGIVYPEDGALIIPGPSAVLKDAKNPNAGKLLLNFLMSKENDVLHAKHFGQPIRPDVSAPEGSKPLEEVKTVKLSFEDLVTGIPEVRTVWRDTFGN